MQYSVLDLFAGCGGLGLGFKRSEKFKIHLANDIWQPAKDTYTYNNPEIPFLLDDIKNLTEDIFKVYYPNGVDVIIGGPPCQGFSMCGARDVNDDRNDLFYEYARIVNYTKPYIFIMENVKGLLSMKNKKGNRIIDAIYEEFENIGYTIQHKVINSKYYKVPQSRERVIIVGTRNDLPNNYKYPEPQLTEDDLYTVENALYRLPNNDSLEGELAISEIDHDGFYDSVKSDGKIYNHQIPLHKKDVEHRMAFVPQGGNWKDIPEEFRAGGIHSNAYRRLDLNKPSVTIKHAYKSMIIHPVYNRCLSIREVARLQSFPDNYIFKNNKTSQYQQLANAVPPNLSKSLADSVLEYLLENCNMKTDTLINSIIQENKFTENKQLNIFDTNIEENIV